MKVTNELLAEGFSIQQEIKHLTQRLNEIKDAVLARGGYNGREFMGVIEKRVEIRSLSKAELVERFDTEFLTKNGLLKSQDKICVRIMRRVYGTKSEVA